MNLGMWESAFKPPVWSIAEKRVENQIILESKHEMLFSRF